MADIYSLGLPPAGSERRFDDDRAFKLFYQAPRVEFKLCKATSRKKLQIQITNDWSCCVQLDGWGGMTLSSFF